MRTLPREPRNPGGNNASARRGDDNIAKALSVGYSLLGGGEGVAVTVPEGLDWFVWRVLTHTRAPSKSLIEIQERWSLDDLLDANVALDVWDELEAASQAALEAKQRAQRAK